VYPEGTFWLLLMGRTRKGEVVVVVLFTPAIHTVIGEFKFTEFSAISNQNCSSARSDDLLYYQLLEQHFTLPIEAPQEARIWSFIFLSALNTPQPKAPEPPSLHYKNIFRCELIIRHSWNFISFVFIMHYKQYLYQSKWLLIINWLKYNWSDVLIFILIIE